MNKRRTWAALCLAVAVCAASAPGQERFRQKIPAPDPQPEFRLPRLESITLSNGLRMTVVFRESAPMTSLHLIFSCGEQASPEKTPGLATLAAVTFGQGTQLHSAAEIEERIESIGGSFAVSADQDVILLGFHFLEEHLDEALDLIAEMILLPLIGDREIKIVQSMVSSEMTAEERDPSFLAHRFLGGFLFQGHPYGKFAFGRSGIKTWTPRDLLEFWDRYIRPNNAQIVLTGSVNINTASRKISHVLNTWRPRDVTPVPLPPPRPPDRTRICFIDLPQASQCTICAGTVLPPLVPGERFALMALGQLLGGSINSRLFLNLRESKGYAYETYSRPEFYRAGGAFTVRAVVRPEVVAASVREIFSEIRRLTREPVSLDEIGAAKFILMGGFPIQLDRYDNFSGYVAAMKAAGAGEELWSRFPENMLEVDSDRILQTAQKYLSQPFVVVIAGSGKLCRDGLAEFDEVEIFDARGQLLETIKK
ncbi:MAG: pitrilysin family protein [Candidatus Aminicenantes bacterium]|nr:pitrilysin family protein [Candidatus Aminicenantes bacterium]